MKLTETPNRLANEKSPYLLQHAHNPVNWYPWSDEAFSKAEAEDKPIFLSIGYSTCHWCHVMERESFEDTEVAEILNKNFISIKVDREERPDIDTIYMAFCQAITGQGGWPLTVFLTPDKKPFFAGTYFPKKDTRGIRGLISLLKQITELWQNQKNKILSSVTDITNAIENNFFSHDRGTVTEDTLLRAYDYYENSFDPVYGGFGSAPKFPAPHNLSFLLRFWKMTGRERALEIVEKTLESMYLGGMYDHIGFGFSRYSTDRQWLVPHFEKMLYDNALLAIAYLEAYQAGKKEKWAKIARDIFSYVLRDMTSPEGAFYSAEDADSEGEEGKFYVWTPDEIKEVLGNEEGEQICQQYDITLQGNFEGKSIPNLIRTGYQEGNLKALNQLFIYRNKRIHPFKDDKILTAWNGLMIAALSLGSRVLNEPQYAEAAEKAAEFITQKLRRSDGRLLARYRDGSADFPAYVDDYAFLVWGLIELYQATFKPGYLSLALELNRDMLKLFWDNSNGGLFQYGSDAENLISRPKEIYDGAMPSGNSVAALNLIKLARYTGDTDLEKKFRLQLETFGGAINKSPMSHANFLMSVWFDIMPSLEITLSGNPESNEMEEMLRVINRSFHPELLLTVRVPGKEDEEISTAYVCTNHSCQQPITSVKKLAELLT
ncbi:thioredoxin domain-containing protein [Phosphitispora sp. TUW77]|uniref:thioredoxin domain-containing protein n=1 Tax=Phosphitispora sp. TUW77 TaxID=3152361 RepID=UPI003AB45666